MHTLQSQRRPELSSHAFFADLPHYLMECGDPERTVVVLRELKKSLNSLSRNPAPEGLDGCQGLLDAGLGAALIALLRQQMNRGWLSTAVAIDDLPRDRRTETNAASMYYVLFALGCALHLALPHRYHARMLDEGALDVLMPVLAGSLSWVEARLALRCLAHLAVDGSTCARILAAGAVPAVAHFAMHIEETVIQHNIVQPSRSCPWVPQLLTDNPSSAATRPPRGHQPSPRAEAWCQVDMANNLAFNFLQRWVCPYLQCSSVFLQPVWLC
jgi:hypothetical protein